jgi:integrase
VRRSTTTGREEFPEDRIIARHVFCYTVGEKKGKPITFSGFNKAWRKARIAAGWPGRIPHDFRRTAVRDLVRAGVPDRVAIQLDVRVRLPVAS